MQGKYYENRSSYFGLRFMTVEAPFSKRLKAARLLAGLTQQQLGVLAGIVEENAGAKMNQYEQGVHIPKFPRLLDLAKALQVPTAYFYAESDQLAELLYAYEKLSKKKQKELVSLIK